MPDDATAHTRDTHSACQSDASCMFDVPSYIERYGVGAAVAVGDSPNHTFCRLHPAIAVAARHNSTRTDLRHIKNIGQLSIFNT